MSERTRTHHGDEVDRLRAALAQAERERDEAHRLLNTTIPASAVLATMDAHARADAAEDRAQRYREALEFYATHAPVAESHAVARRALSADPLVCRDPNLCWGKGTCPRDPACDE